VIVVLSDVWVGTVEFGMYLRWLRTAATTHQQSFASVLLFAEL
jgi:hypothetical protein